MKVDKALLSGSHALLVLKLLEEGDKYGYEMIETLASRSDHTFEMKAGTLYPLLHSLEEKTWIEAYDAETAGRLRRYYRLTDRGRRALAEKEASWNAYADAMRRVLKGGLSLGNA